MRVLACLQVVYPNLSVVKEQSLSASLVRLEKELFPLYLGHLLCRRPMAGGYDGGLADGCRERRLRCGGRLCPRRRAVDCAAVGNVKMWNCGNVKVWKYENGLGLRQIPPRVARGRAGRVGRALGHE